MRERETQRLNGGQEITRNRRLLSVADACCTRGRRAGPEHQHLKTQRSNLKIWKLHLPPCVHSPVKGYAARERRYFTHLLSHNHNATLCPCEHGLKATLFYMMHNQGGVTWFGNGAFRRKTSVQKTNAPSKKTDVNENNNFEPRWPQPVNRLASQRRMRAMMMCLKLVARWRLCGLRMLSPYG